VFSSTSRLLCQLGLSASSDLNAAHQRPHQLNVAVLADAEHWGRRLRGVLRWATCYRRAKMGAEGTMSRPCGRLRLSGDECDMRVSKFTYYKSGGHIISVCQNLSLVCRSPVCGGANYSIISSDRMRGVSLNTADAQGWDCGVRWP
jgi:hypothetical protein